MLLTILIAALAACGPLMILLALKDAFLPRPRRSCHVIYLDPGQMDPAALAQACLWRRRGGALTGKLIFVDGGIDASSRAAIERLLQKADEAVLCLPAQAADYLETEYDGVGTGADQRDHRSGRL